MALLSTPKPQLKPKGLITIPHSHGGRVQPKPHHAAPGGAGAGAGAGLPVMKSAKQLQAEANAQTWKSIQNMMAQLPDAGTIDAPYSAQRAAIAPLVDAHRDWLLNAGNYQTQVTNGLASLIYDQGGAADTQQTGGAARAGMPGGGGFQGNVTPGQLSAIPTAIGGSTANWLQSMLPAATAQGIGNVGRVNANEQTALDDLYSSRKQVAGQYGDLYDKNFTSLSNAAFDDYKSELAAIAAGAGADAKTTAAADKRRHEKVMEGIAQQRLGDANARASNATTTAAAKTLASLTKADKSLTTKALTDARKVYSTLGGVKKSGSQTTAAGPQAFMSTIEEVFPPGNSALGQGTQKPKTSTFYGSTPAEVQAKIRAFVKAHPALKNPSDPSQSGHYNFPGVKNGPTGSTTTSSSATVDRPSESTRRLRAWRTFKSELAQLNSPLSSAQMQALFRRQFGDPA